MNRRFRESKDNGAVQYNDIYSCDLRWDIYVDIADKKKFEQLRDEDLVLYSKTEKDVNLDWKMFQDEIGYLKDDIGASDFRMRLQLTNGTLHIYITSDEDNSEVMEYYIVPKIVTD